MATNIYRTHQVIEYPGIGDRTCYGWYLSGTSYSMSVTYFANPHFRLQFIELVREKLGAQAEAVDVEDLAALLCFIHFGDTDDDREVARQLLQDWDEVDYSYLEEDEEIAEFWDDGPAKKQEQGEGEGKVQS